MILGTEGWYATCRVFSQFLTSGVGGLEVLKRDPGREGRLYIGDRSPTGLPGSFLRQPPLRKPLHSAPKPPARASPSPTEASPRSPSLLLLLPCSCTVLVAVFDVSLLLLTAVRRIWLKMKRWNKRNTNDMGTMNDWRNRPFSAYLGYGRPLERRAWLFLGRTGFIDPKCSVIAPIHSFLRRGLLRRSQNLRTVGCRYPSSFALRISDSSFAVPFPAGVPDVGEIYDNSGNLRNLTTGSFGARFQTSDDLLLLSWLYIPFHLVSQDRSATVLCRPPTPVLPLTRLNPTRRFRGPLSHEDSSSNSSYGYRRDERMAEYCRRDGADRPSGSRARRPCRQHWASLLPSWNVMVGLRPRDLQLILLRRSEGALSSGVVDPQNRGRYRLDGDYEDMCAMRYTCLKGKSEARVPRGGGRRILSWSACAYKLTSISTFASIVQPWLLYPSPPPMSSGRLDAPNHDTTFFSLDHYRASLSLVFQEWVDRSWFTSQEQGVRRKSFQEDLSVAHALTRRRAGPEAGKSGTEIFPSWLSRVGRVELGVQNPENARSIRLTSVDLPASLGFSTDVRNQRFLDVLVCRWAPLVQFSGEGIRGRQSINTALRVWDLFRLLTALHSL
ncbi:hypothetical protein NMY22_g16791 [Coprinellus aureogranulatus]|nr:hypothetical protein NMY22_g16791 [Coprinellus aureogranulatus]